MLVAAAVSLRGVTAMKSKLNTARSAALATAILAYLSPQAASSLTISVPVFEQISPLPTIYNFGVDFSVVAFSAPGDVTASVQAIPNVGCFAADFAGFSAGSIALIARGFCEFRDKIALAAVAGAAATLISNNVPGLGTVSAISPTQIPALFTTMAIGDDLRGLLAVNEVTARIAVPVPGPIAGAGLPGLILAIGGLLGWWRRRRLKFRGNTMSYKSALIGAVLASTVALSIAAPVRADTIFDLTGTFADSTTVSGTLTIDLTTGHIDAANLIYGGNTYSTILLQQPFTGNTAPGQTPVPVSYNVFIGISSSILPRIDLGIPGTSAVDSLVSYAGGSLCSTSANCGPDQLGITYASAFFPPSGTPTFLLLQTGELIAVPGPIAGAGVPGLILACGILLALARHRRKSA
jgi:PA domain